MAPSEVIDYIVVHELAHLRESNYTQVFWDIVAEYIPDYPEHAEWFTENSTQLIFPKLTYEVPSPCIWSVISSIADEIWSKSVSSVQAIFPLAKIRNTASSPR